MDRLGSGWESWPGFDRRPAQSPLRPVPFGLKTARPAEKGAVSGINRLPGYFLVDLIQIGQGTVSRAHKPTVEA